MKNPTPETVTVGAFTMSGDTITGPADYMASDQYARKIERILAGRDVANQGVKFERMTIDGLEVVVRVHDGWVSWCSDWIAIHNSAKFETRWELEGIWRQGEFYLRP